MKTLLIYFFLLLPFSFCKAQSKSSKSEQYCEVICSGRTLSPRIKIDMGSYSNKYKDSSVYKQEYFSKFRTPVDALNYLERFGWRLVSVYSGKDIGGEDVHFYTLARTQKKR